MHLNIWPEPEGLICRPNKVKQSNYYSYSKLEPTLEKKSLDLKIIINI